MNITFFVIQYKKHIKQILITLSFALVLTGCNWSYDDRTELEKVRDAGVLRVGTLNNQLSYFIGPDGPTGLEYELASQFAEFLGVRLEIEPEYTLSDLFPALERNEVDIVAAGLTVTSDRIQKFRPGPAYYYVTQQLVYKNGHWRPRTLKELNKDGARIAVVEGSSHANTLQDIQQRHPELKWEKVRNSHSDELLKDVAEGKLDFTISNSINIAMVQRTHPSITVAMELSEEEPVAWFTRQAHDDSLYALMIDFFGQKNQTGELATLEERYFGHMDNFDFVDTRAFIRAIQTTLPKWKPLFQKYTNDLDWRLLAALSYQESHWNPNAVSPTGVRGMMMLTLPTAKSVGVEDRLDPEQSIRGGAQYLQRMLKRVPASINAEEKIWFALASYNIGFGHMMDARRLTEDLGGNPDSWTDVKQNLPLLTKQEYYQKMRYGFARGHEALNYVENIRRYYQSIIGYELDKAQAIKSNMTKDIAELQTINQKKPTEQQTFFPSKVSQQ